MSQSTQTLNRIADAVGKSKGKSGQSVSRGCCIMGKSSNFAPTGEEYSEGLAWCRQRLKDLKQPVM
jgi:hypothetical protein